MREILKKLKLFIPAVCIALAAAASHSVALADQDSDAARQTQQVRSIQAKLLSFQISHCEAQPDPVVCLYALKASAKRSCGTDDVCKTNATSEIQEVIDRKRHEQTKAILKNTN